MNYSNVSSCSEWYKINIELQHSIDRADLILKESVFKDLESVIDSHNDTNDTNDNNIESPTSINEECLDFIDGEWSTPLYKCKTKINTLKEDINYIKSDMVLTASELKETINLYEAMLKRRSSMVSISSDLCKYVDMINEDSSHMPSAKRLQEAFEDHLNVLLNDKEFNKVCEDIVKLYKKIFNMQSITRLIASAQPTPTCSICLSEPVQLISTNCGHGGCDHCFRQMGYCPVCRSPINHKCRIYI